jgi:hypothetical protein
VHEKSFGMRHFGVFAYPEEPKRGPSRAAEVAWDGKSQRDGPNGGDCEYTGSQPRVENGNTG